KETAGKLKIPGLFINRATQEWYELIESETGKKIKGGTIDFLWENDNPVSKVVRAKWNGDTLLYGSELKQKIQSYFTQQRKLKFEVFTDWMPNDDCFVTLSDNVADKWGDPVGKIHIGSHPHDRKVSEQLAKNTLPI